VTAPSTGGPPRQLRPTDVKRLNRDWRRRADTRLALLLDSVGQPFNVGSIVRSAAAFGAGQLWLCGNTAALDHSSARKTALGTERFLDPILEPDPVAAVKAARADGYRVVAIELASGAVPLHEAPLEGDICLVVGNEDHGCSPALLATVDAVAYIPQPSRVGSLNVAVAAAIAMADVRRRDWQRLPPGPASGAYSPTCLSCLFSIIRARWRSPTAAVRLTTRKTRWPPSGTRCRSATPTWRPMPAPPRTAHCWPSMTPAWTG
jgi:tRNA (guanosine-2'-O-)-methyltransferase